MKMSPRTASAFRCALGLSFSFVVFAMAIVVATYWLIAFAKAMS